MSAAIVRRLSAEMEEAIARLGYLFEQQLVPLIAEAGYYPIPNYRYDNRDGSQSELDIYAIQAKKISGPRGFVWITLLIECKNLSCPLVFFSHKQPLRSSMFLGKPHIAGLPQQVVRRDRQESIADFFNLEAFHHYYSRNKVATQFCAVFERKSGARAAGSKAPPRTSDDYIAGHQVGELDLYRDGILNLSHAVAADKRDFASRFKKNEIKDERVDLWFHYPVFVTAGTLYECSIARRSSRYKRVHRLGFLHRGGEGVGRIGDCRIDVVDPVGLRDLLKVIDRETDRILSLIRTNSKLLGRSRRLLAGKLNLMRISADRVVEVIAGEELKVN